MVSNVIAYAYDAEIDGLWYNLNTNKLTAEVTYRDYYNRCYNTNWKYLNVTIPATVTCNGIIYTVTSIGDNAFNSCYILKSVQLPNTIKSIGKSAFEGCWELNNVIIPDSVNTIGDAAFQNCNKLYSIEIPNCVTEMGEYVFYGCDHLTFVRIHGTIHEIKPYSFALCNRLSSIVIPNTVERIGYYAFWYCSMLTFIEIPYSITTITSNAFADCNRLTTITINSNTIMSNRHLKNLFGEQVSIYNIGEDVTEIGHGVFSNCNNLKEINVDSENKNYCSLNGVLFSKDMIEIIQYPIGKIDSTFVIPNGVIRIIEGAFKDCANLKTINLPISIGYIEKEAFYGCSNLRKIDIPDEVTSIGYSSFYKCINLASITIGNHISKINGYAFSECISLKTITSNAIDVPELGNDVFYNVNKSACTLYVPEESIAIYQAADVWKEFNPILPLPKTEAINNIYLEKIQNRTTKKIVSNQILIFRGEKTYTITGQEVK